MGNDLSLDAQAFLWSQQGDIDPVLLGMMGRDPASSIFDYPTAYSRLKYAQEKYKRSPSSKTIGLKSPTLVVRATGTLTDNTDFTLYPDRAILNLVNDTAGNVTVTGISIRGLPVKQYTDAYRWLNVDYDDIDKRGEVPLVIENEYICTKDHLEDVGDYTTKLAVSNPEYTLTIPGCHYEYNIGDVWHLTLSYTIQGQVSECENIDTDVEIRSISIDRQVGSIGNTTILVSPPPGAWTKTTNRRARLISLGMANLLNNRGNVISVGSSTWTGQADYYCDGTDDDVQIQAAIDYLSDAYGGGVVSLTEGYFYASSVITLKAGIHLAGTSSGGTVIANGYDAGASITSSGTIINIQAATEGSVSNLSIDGLSGTKNYPFNELFVIYGLNTQCPISNVKVKNISISGTGVVLVHVFIFCTDLSSCYVSDISASSGSGSGNIQVIGFEACQRITSCYVDDITCTAIGAAENCYSAGFVSCDYINNCISESLSIVNSTGSGYSVGYLSCSKATNCLSNNTGTATYGYFNCNSLSQCKSVGNSTHYLISYADAGTSNAAADTSAGGFNS